MHNDLEFDYTEATTAMDKFSQSDIEEIRNWILKLDKSKFVPKSLSDKQIVLFYNACYGNIEKTKICIENYYNCRKNASELFDYRVWNADLRKAAEVAEVFLVPEKSPEGYEIIYHRHHDEDPSNFDLQSVSKLLFMILDVSLSKQGPQPGYIVLFDMDGIKIGLTKLNLSIVRKLFQYLQEAAPIRMHAIHILNAESLLDKILLLAKPFIHQEMFSIIKIHNKNEDIERLYEFVPRSCLPSNYGGTLPDTTTLQKRCIEELQLMLPYFKFEEEQRLAALPDKNSDDTLEGLLDTLDTQVDIKTCPGTCIHSLAALLCNEVIEEVECPGTSMKCCADDTGGNDTQATTHRPHPTRHTTVDDDDYDEPTTQAPADKYKNSGNIACPGVCVESRLTPYCEAYLTSTDLCVKGRLCCVSKDGYGDRPPPDLVVPNEKKYSTKRPSTALTTTPAPKQRPGRKCRGDCISGLFSLLCDNVDEDAVCPGEGVCCITDNKAVETTTRRPATTHRPRPTTPVPLPRCPGYCLHGIMRAFCESPAVLVSHTHCKMQGFICCDNTRVPPRTTHRPTTTTTTTTTTPAPVDPRPDCPGSCIVSLLSFTCFRNAEMTDVFKCKKAGTQCCAPKSKVLEVVGGRPANESAPLPMPQPATSYQHYTTSLMAHTHTTPMGTVDVPYEPSYGTTLSSTEKYNKYVCGVKGTTSRSSRRLARVMGGEDGERGEWCWQVALINSLNQYLCGAALIGTQWVLTAAHCVTNIVRSGDAIYVRVGDHDLTRKYGSPGAQTLRVATTYIHHNHNSQTLDNDIALLKLHGKAELKEGVCLVCLPARGVSHAAGKRCTVTGYGYMGETGPIPLRVREAELPIVSDAECIRKVNAVTEKIFILPASSFCAGGESGNDACQGDGGGPLVCQDDGFYELVGLVSWGFGCGRQDVPGVYVKVSSFIGWINQIISVNNL